MNTYSQNSEEYNSIYRQVHKRISNSITFYGYREIYNALFWTDERTRDLKVNPELLKNL